MGGGILNMVILMRIGDFMKKGKLLKRLIFICILILSSCTSKTNLFKGSYLIVIPGQEDVRQELITLEIKDTKNFKDDFEAVISGDCFVSEEIGSYTIDEQIITISQVYGNIFSGKVKFISIDEEETFYFHCLGENPTTSKQLIDIGNGKTINAIEYESYININYIIAYSNLYLI